MKKRKKPIKFQMKFNAGKMKYEPVIPEKQGRTKKTRIKINYKWIIVIIIGIILITYLALQLFTDNLSSKQCSTDSDCVVFGETGDCNCGCYNKDNLPADAGGKCFCAAPTSCECIDGKCEGVFK